MIAVNALIIYIRSEPVVQIWSAMIVLGLLANLLMRLYIDGYANTTYFTRCVEWLASQFVAPIGLLQTIFRSDKPSTQKKTIRASAGAMIALPLVLIFIGLFASSDVVFRDSFQWLGDILTAIVDVISQLDVAKFITIGFWTVLALAWVAVAVSTNVRPSEARIVLPKSLTVRDYKIIHLSIISIFAVYAVIQVNYLFGGAKLPAGMTYAMYARRGYGELLVATVLASLVIYFTHRLVHTVANKLALYPITLLGLNMFVVVSAWRRLSLYEAAYGWTMTRFVARLGLVTIFFGGLFLGLWLLNRISVKRLYSANAYALMGILTLAGLLNPVGLVTERTY